MADVWLFGIFASNNNNLDPKKTADRLAAKWRSQTKVPEGSQVFGDFDSNYNAAKDDPSKKVTIGSSLATATVHAVYISDLEYQLRTTEAITDNTRRLKPILNSGLWAATESVTASRIYPTRVEFGELTFVPDSTNPNPNPFIKPTPTPKPLINLGYQSFAETRLELGYDYGAVGGMGYRTEIIEVSDGREQRNATRSLPLGRWQLGNRAIAESSADLLAEVSYLKQFHLDRKGSFQGFRFKDWSDYEGINQDIATGDGLKTQFQLRKAYSVGSAVTYRPIQKPVPGTVALFVNGVRALDVSVDPVNGWHINNETGVVTGNLAAGATLRADFEFDVPVWFEADEIGFRLEAYEPETLAAIYRLESVFVVESPIPPAIPWSAQPLTQITEELDLGIIYDTVEQLSFSTAKQELKSGYALRQSKRDDSKLLVNLGDRNYDRAEVDKILAYFWNARGSLTEFPFKNLDKSYKVRFDQDQLNLKFEAASDSDKFLNLSGLKLQAIVKIPPVIPILDLSDLYGHYTYLESAPNADFYNYHVYGQNKLVKTADLQVIVSNSKSNVYLLESTGNSQNVSSLTAIPFSTFSRGFSIALNTIRNLDIGYSFIDHGNNYGAGGFRVEYSSNTTPSRWIVFINGVSVSAASIRSSLPLAIDFSLTFVFEKSDTGAFTCRIYVNNVLDAALSFPKVTIIDSAGTKFQISQTRPTGAIQVWKIPLSQVQIDLLYSNGQRQPLRSASIKDTAVAKQLVVAANGTNYGFLSNSLGALSPLIPLNNTNLPVINNNLIEFSGLNRRLSFSFCTFALQLILFVFKSTQPYVSGSTFNTIIFTVKVEAGGSQFAYSMFEFSGNLYFDLQNITTSQLSQSTYPLPADFFDGEIKEIGFDISDGKMYVNGLEMPRSSYVTYNQNNYSGLANSSIGFRVEPTNSTPTRVFQVALLLPLSIGNSFSSINYTANNFIPHRIARLFYQMGFKKSLTRLEPNNARLLNGNYPI